MTFKKGDRIVVTEKSAPIPLKSTGTVLDYMEDFFGKGPTVKVELDHARGIWYCDPDSIQLVTGKFKSGDRVVVKSGVSTLFGENHGTIELSGTEPHGMYRVRLDGGKDTWWVGEDSLEAETGHDDEPRAVHIVIDIDENTGSVRYLEDTDVVYTFSMTRSTSVGTPDEFDTVMTLIRNIYPNGRLKMVSTDDCECCDESEDCCAQCDDDEEQRYDDDITIPGFIKVYDDDDMCFTFLSARNISHISGCYDEVGDGYTEIGTSSGDVFHHPAPIDEFAKIITEALDE